MLNEKLACISSILESSNKTIETAKHMQIAQEILIAIYVMKQQNNAIRRLHRKSKRDYLNNLINKSQWKTVKENIQTFLLNWRRNGA